MRKSWRICSGWAPKILVASIAPQTLYPRVGLLRKNRYAVGAAYAIFVSSVMDYVVLPLSAFSSQPPSYTSVHTYIGWAVLTLAFGIPNAIGAASYYERSEPRA